MKQQLNTLKPVHITELETEFNNLGNERAVPKRYLKSQKPKTTCVSDPIMGDDSEGKLFICFEFYQVIIQDG